MSKFRFLVISMTVMIAAAMTPAAVAQQATQNVQQLERDIEMNEKNIKQNEDSIKSLEDRIENLKSQIKELESQKKALEKDVKNETKMRRDKFTLRDELVYDEEIAEAPMSSTIPTIRATSMKHSTASRAWKPRRSSRRKNWWRSTASTPRTSKTSWRR